MRPVKRAHFKPRKSLIMKRIKTKDIDPTKLITKAKYAKEMGLSQTAISKQIARGELVIVVANGAELIHK